MSSSPQATLYKLLIHIYTSICVFLSHIYLFPFHIAECISIYRLIIHFFDSFVFCCCIGCTITLLCIPPFSLFFQFPLDAYMLLLPFSFFLVFFFNVPNCLSSSKSYDCLLRKIHMQMKYYHSRGLVFFPLAPAVSFRVS